MPIRGIWQNKYGRVTVMKKTLYVLLAMLVCMIFSSCGLADNEETTLNETTTVQTDNTFLKEITDIVGSLAPLCIIDNSDNSFIKANESYREELTDAFKSMISEAEAVGMGKSYTIYASDEVGEKIFTYYPENRIVEYNNVCYSVIFSADEKFREIITPVTIGDNAEICEQAQDEFIYYRIDMIYPDCIICHSGLGNPFVTYRFNFEVSEKFCVGDYVDITTVDGSYQRSADHDVCEAAAKDVQISTFEIQPGVAYKPVIYLYPEEKSEISVKLDVNGDLLCSEPLYNDGWTVTAAPDGILTDENGTYNYLFWEADMSAVEFDMSEGFCVKGANSEEFFREKLSFIGLNEKEINDYLEFWLPYVLANAYNYITFQADCYTDNAKLEISPVPDSVIRVYTVIKPLDAPIQTVEPVLEQFNRTGFTVVEWGGGVVSGNR